MSSIKALTSLIVDSYREDGGANHIGGLHLPSRARVARLLTDIEEVIFPGFACDDSLTDDTLEIVTGARVARLLDALTTQVALDMAHERRISGGAAGVAPGVVDVGVDAVDPALARDARAFTVALLEHVPILRVALNLDVEALFAGDPAVRSREEIILAYPGLEAIAIQRTAHVLYLKNVPVIPRMMTEWAHSRTGIDIHPGAEIGTHFFIDHGTGVVIGETTTLGNHVKLYQGVGLVAKSLAAGQALAGKKRHPTLEDRVTIYAGATIVGGDTVIGARSIIGANVFLMESVAPDMVYALGDQEHHIRDRKQTPVKNSPKIGED